jgi:hypothetical protein
MKTVCVCVLPFLLRHARIYVDGCYMRSSQHHVELGCTASGVYKYDGSVYLELGQQIYQPPRLVRLSDVEVTLLCAL